MVAKYWYGAVVETRSSVICNAPYRLSASMVVVKHGQLPITAGHIVADDIDGTIVTSDLEVAMVRG